MYCSECGKLIDNEATFCSNCGKKIKSSVETNSNANAVAIAGFVFSFK